ncbi:tetratricopeptide repeat protein [Thiomicrorhabdus sp.]|uniref:tetratricopeptide repeat protein n=1 Tax=Thiomicrorhabdus sp. TaxID=2039724 RepID=UPI0029C978A4|nr:tetratricopeptide repeat protein [Thiomicrorhabdus sp.]
MKKLVKLLIIAAYFSAVHAVAGEKGLSPSVYEHLQNAMALSKSGENRQAISSLKALLGEIDKEPYAKAIVEQQLAYAYLKTDNYSKARAFGRSALNSGELPPEAVHGLHWLLAQLAFQQDDYSETIRYAGLWVENESSGKVGKGLFLIGYSYYHLDQYRNAASRFEAAIKSEKSPPVDWQKLLLASYMQSKNYAKAEGLLRSLIERQPKTLLWWEYLVGIYLQRDKEDKALAALVLAYNHHRLKSEDVMRMVQLFDYRGIPFKAAELMQKSIDEGRFSASYKNLQLLGQLWLNARERKKALETLTKAAALSKKGRDDLLIGRLHMENGQWKEAVGAFRRALSKGGLKDRARTKLFLGITAYYDGQFKLARTSLTSAGKVPALRKEADYWLAKLAN